MTDPTQFPSVEERQAFAQKLGRFVVENKDSKLPGCR